MQTALLNEERVISFELSKDDRSLNGTYQCPACKDPVMLKYGEINIPHFSHYSDSDCSYGSGESELHMELKMKIYNELKKFPNSEIDIEKQIGNRRADVVFNDTVIEIQLSYITLEEVKNRYTDYSSEGYDLIWIFGGKFYKIKNSSILKYIIFNKDSNIYFWFCGDFILKRNYTRYMTILNHDDVIEKTETYFPIKEIIRGVM